MTLKALFAMLALSVVALAGDINGKWKYEMRTQGGETREATMEFKAEGEKLTGSVAGRGGPAPISEGKISGDDVSFVVVRNFNGEERKMQYKGKLSGDELNLTTSFGDREIAIKATRVK